MELQFGEDHLSPEERAIKVSDILRKSLSNYLGKAPNNTDLVSFQEDVRKVLGSSGELSDIEFKEGSAPGVMDVSLTLPLVDRELHYVRVDIDLNDRKQQDEDSVSWKAVFGAIGVATLMSYIAGKPKHSDRKHDVVSTQEVANATL